MNIFKKLFNKKKIEGEHAEYVEYINREEELIEFVKQGGVIVCCSEKDWRVKIEKLENKGIPYIFTTEEEALKYNNES